MRLRDTEQQAGNRTSHVRHVDRTGAVPVRKHLAAEADCPRGFVSSTTDHRLRVFVQSMTLQAVLATEVSGARECTFRIKRDTCAGLRWER